MTWVWISVKKKGQQKCEKGVRDYIDSHLQSPKEGGSLLLLPGYVDINDRVLPIILNPITWDAAGLRYPSRVLEPSFVTNLCKGRDTTGRRLTWTNVHKAPVETLITLPCELSEALRDYPAAAHRILLAAVLGYLRWLDLLTVRRRVDGKIVTAPASTLSLYYPHARNKTNEAHLHAHVLTFCPALDAEGYWRMQNIYNCIFQFHQPGGVRDTVTQVVIAAAALEGFTVVITPGKASDGLPSGATVTCPDGRVIYNRSVSRLRSAQVLERRELKRELGVPPLTEPELAVVRDYALKGLGHIPKGMSRLRNKLQELGLLCSTQSNYQDLLKGLARMDKAMAVIEAALAELPFLEGAWASELVRNRRGRLQEMFPEMRKETSNAKNLWTRRYDQALQLLANASAGLSSVDLPQETKNTIFMIHRAGVLLRHYQGRRTLFRLGPSGNERYLRGRQEQQDVEAAVPELMKRATIGSTSPSMTRGRLVLAGVVVHGNNLEFLKLGRTVPAGKVLLQAGITAATPETLDLKWWEKYYDRRADLSRVLAVSILRPEDLPSKTLALARNIQNPYHSAKKRPQKASPAGSPLGSPPTSPTVQPPSPRRRAHQPARPPQSAKSAINNAITTGAKHDKKR